VTGRLSFFHLALRCVLIRELLQTHHRGDKVVNSALKVLVVDLEMVNSLGLVIQHLLWVLFLQVLALGLLIRVGARGVAVSVNDSNCG